MVLCCYFQKFFCNQSDNFQQVQQEIYQHLCLLVIINMKVLLCFLSLLTLLASQRFPRPAILDINDLYSNDIARDGKQKFWKVDGNYWSTIISSNPVQNNTLTKIKIYLQIGATFMIGCGKKDKQRMKSQYVGQIPNTVSYYSENGMKYKDADAVSYAQKSMQGDTVTMIIDLREHEKLVKFQKNDRPLGIAYSGLQDWENIYIMFSIHWVGHKFKILEYSVYE